MDRTTALILLLVSGLLCLAIADAALTTKPPLEDDSDASVEPTEMTAERLMDIEKLEKALHIPIKKIKYYNDPDEKTKVRVSTGQDASKQERNRNGEQGRNTRQPTVNPTESHPSAGNWPGPRNKGQRNDTGPPSDVQIEDDLNPGSGQGHGPFPHKELKAIGVRYKGYIKHKYGSDMKNYPADLAFNSNNLPQCTFESGMCDFANFDMGDEDWERLYAGSATGSYKPAQDVTDYPDDTGYYMYADAWPMFTNDMAIFGPKYFIQPTRTMRQYCLRFSYLIYGNSLGDLRVAIGYKDDDLDISIKWEKSGSQGLKWTSLGLSFPVVPNEDFYFVFVAVQRSSAGAGGFAIDDVTLSEGDCSSNSGSCSAWGRWGPWDTCSHTCNSGTRKRSRTRSGSGCSTTMTSQTGKCNTLSCPTSNVLYSCNFEGACNLLKNNLYNDYDWETNQGTTPSTGTGPSNDATPGVAIGHYLYAEATGVSEGDVASVYINHRYTTERICIRFNYHMYGSGMGKLRQLIYFPDTETLDETWSESGNKGNSWRWVAISRWNLNRPYVIYITAVRGSDYKSDIAIDDIKVTTGNCET